MGVTELNIGSFCTGVGWLDCAAKLACEYHGIRTKSVFASEWDSYAAAVLKSRMEDEALESCPIWCGDLRDFPAEDFHGVVDAIVAGFPCQDISVAGKQTGIHGERSGLWFDILDAAVRMGARWLFLENVSAITANGLDAVLSSLAESGFNAEWLCLRASDVGASHRRDRWFCVAEREERGQRELREPSGCDGQSNGSGETVEDAERPEQGNGNGQVPSTECGRDRSEPSEPMGDTSQSRPQGTRLGAETDRGPESRTADRVCDLFAPGPGDPAWAFIVEEFPHLVPAIIPGLHVLVDGRSVVVDESRADQLRCSGNGVVVAQAACAFAELIRRVNSID